MAKGQRSSILTNSRGADYWKKMGFMKRTTGWMAGISHKAGTNKYTKRCTHKGIRQQVRQWLHHEEYE